MKILWHKMSTFFGSISEFKNASELLRLAVCIIMSSSEMIGSRIREFAILNCQGAAKPNNYQKSQKIAVANISMNQICHRI